MLKSIDGPTEAAGVSNGEFKDCLAVKYILFAAFRLSLGEAWLQTDCGGRVTAVLLNKNDGTIICPSSSADLRELFSVKIYIFAPGTIVRTQKPLLWNSPNYRKKKLAHSRFAT